MDVTTFGYVFFGGHIAGALVGAAMALTALIRDARENATKLADLLDLPTRQVFYLDVGELQPEQALEFVDELAPTPIRNVPAMPVRYDPFDFPGVVVPDKTLVRFC